MSKYAPLALKVALLALAVLVVAFLPRFIAQFRVEQLTYVAIYFIALTGLNILTGYNGQISLAQGAFMAVGAYTAALLTLGRPGLEEATRLNAPGFLPLGDGMSPVYTIPLAGLVAGLIGLVFGLPALRLAEVSLALATFGVAVSLPLLAKRFESVTGGGGGLSLPLPKTPFGLDISTGHWLYYEAWGSAGVLLLVAWALVRGRVGRAWRALRDADVAAVSSGVRPATYKTLAFGVSSFYAGVAGALFAIQVAYVNPGTFPIMLSILLLASCVAAGLGSLSGLLFGALLMEFLPIYAQDISRQAPAVAFGAVLIFCMYALPGGVSGLLHRLVTLFTNAAGRKWQKGVMNQGGYE
jgi:branched-chain amino acid transport system permease protein